MGTGIVAIAAATLPLRVPELRAFALAVWMTVGGGTLLAGRDWLGLSAAVDTDWALWALGTVLGLITACWIPYLMMTRHQIEADGAFGGWLMPGVPPMVSAANGALFALLAAAWLVVLARTAARSVRGKAGLPPRSVLRCCYGFNGDATAARG
jgi:tellurite resistance protein TehA-like permease